MKTRMPFNARSFLLRLPWSAAMVLLCVVISRAGGPKHVAGTAYFDSTTTGQPLVWPQGFIAYYTDQGDLSPSLRMCTAVTSPKCRRHHPRPADFQSTATGKPVGIVYDSDGSVTDALIGSGAGVWPF
jgi:hypothetical protein